MTDMTVALRVLADTTGARTGLKQVAESLREMGVGARVAAVDSAEAALRSATAWAQSGAQVSATATAMGAALEAGVPDLSAVLEAQSADLVQTALASAEAAAGVAELRAMLHPLAGAAEAARAGLAEVALAEELGALTAQEAAVLTDRLSRALIDVARSADAAGLPLDGLGPAGRAAATGMQQLIEAQTGVSAASPIAELLAQGQALDDLRARFSPVYGEARRLVTEMAQVADAERQGAISATEAALAFDRLETALSGAQAQAAATGVSLEALGLPARGATTDMQRLIEAQTGVTRGAEGSIAAQLRHGQMLDDLRARFNPLFAQTRQYEQELRDIAEAERLSAITADEAAQARARAAAAMGTLSGGIREIGAASGAATAYTANLGYQLNDIAMMMAAGQNPFMLMMQQGPQVTQVFEQMRASGLSIGASLKSALIGMVSPMSLITMAVIGGGAALVQWLAATGDEADTSQEKVQTFAEKVDDATTAVRRAGDAARVAGAGGLDQLRKDYGAVTLAVVELARELAGIERRAAKVKVELVLDEALGSGFEAQIDRVIGTVGAALTGSFSDQIPAMQAEIAAFEADIARRQGMGGFVAPSEVAQLQRMREELAAIRGDMAGIGSLASEIAVDPALVRDLAAAKAQLAEARQAGDFGAVADALREVHRLLVASGQTIDQAVLDGLTQAEDQARKAAVSLGDGATAAQTLGTAAGGAAGTIGRAGDEAARLAGNLGAAVGALAQIASGISNLDLSNIADRARLAALQKGQSRVQADAAASLAQKRAELAPALGSGEGAVRAVAAQQLAAFEAKLREKTALAEQLSGFRSPGKGGAGAGAGRDGLAGLTGEAQKLLADLAVAQGAVAEKVRAGLLSVADGETEMARAKERAAAQLAELIARLDRLGPAGKAAADAARVALADLAAEAGKADQSIRDGMIKSFEDSFVRSLATGKNAMSAFADHVKMELARAFTQKFVTPMISPLINSLMGMFTGIFSAKGNVIAAGRVVPFASGGVPDLPSLKSHSNTVVDRPTAFQMKGGRVGIMGEAGAEAIIPLLTGAQGPGVRAVAPDGTQAVLPLQRAADGALGVGVPDVGAILRRPSFFAKGGVVGRLTAVPRVGETTNDATAPEGRAPRFNVIINNNHPAAQVTAEQRPGADGMSMEVVIEQVDAAIADRFRRGIGPLSGVLGGSFGLTRQGR